MSQPKSQGGGFDDLTLISNEVYTVSTVVPPSNQMLSSKEKRKNRRAENAQMLENSYARGMDVHPPKFLTWRQEELWNCFKKNTVTVGFGAAGTGKTLIALHYGLFGIAQGQFDKVYYVRSDVGVEF
jgi:phosphate starvation-inducible protein PhoH